MAPAFFIQLLHVSAFKARLFRLFCCSIPCRAALVRIHNVTPEHLRLSGSLNKDCWRELFGTVNTFIILCNLFLDLSSSLVAVLTQLELLSRWIYVAVREDNEMFVEPTRASYSTDMAAESERSSDGEPGS